MYGYTELARELNRRLDIAPPLRAQHIHMWQKRKIRNRAGATFPEPDETNPKTTAGGRVTRYRWEIEPVIAWVMKGIPGNGHGGRGWRYPARRPGINSTEQALYQARATRPAPGTTKGDDEKHVRRDLARAVPRQLDRRRAGGHGRDLPRP